MAVEFFDWLKLAVNMNKEEYDKLKYAEQNRLRSPYVLYLCESGD